MPDGTMAGPAAPAHPERTVLRGAWTTLVPLAAAHAASLWPLAEAAPQTWAWLPHGPFPSAAAFRGYLRFAAASAEETLWAVHPHRYDGEPGDAAGWLGLLDVRPAHAAIELGNIWFPPGLARTRCATEALFLLLDHAFALGYRRVAWKCDSANLASGRAAERLGFALDGVLRAHMIVRNQRRDTAYYSLLDDAWPARRAALLEWLDAGNFDTESRSRAPLRRADVPTPHEHATAGAEPYAEAAQPPG